MLKATLKRLGAILLSLTLLAAILPTTTLAARPARGMLYFNGNLVRTVGLPASIPHGGIDPLYQVTNGTPDQVSVAMFGPGSPNFHGGQWAIYTVTFNPGVTPYLLTSGQAVLDAQAADDVTITRHPELDNRCPILQ
jgi:hypothetical protein